MKSTFARSVAIILCGLLVLVPAFAAADPPVRAPAHKVTRGAEASNPAGIPITKAANTAAAQNGLGTVGWGVLGVFVLGGLTGLGIFIGESWDHESDDGGGPTGGSASHH
jgi:hypothetical protein